MKYAPTSQSLLHSHGCVHTGTVYRHTVRPPADNPCQEYENCACVILVANDELILSSRIKTNSPGHPRFNTPPHRTRQHCNLQLAWDKAGKTWSYPRTRTSVQFVNVLITAAGVKRPGRDVDHPCPFSTEVKDRGKLHLYSPSGSSWPTLGRTLPLLQWLHPLTYESERDNFISLNSPILKVQHQVNHEDHEDIHVLLSLIFILKSLQTLTYL